MGRIHLGTSGYVYPHWRRLLYPEGLPASKWLERYAQVFSTVELNATFYRLPTAHAVEGWRDGTPPGFIFATKGSRYLTHIRRLKEIGLGVDRFLYRVDLLGPKLGVVLWQLPPNMKRDLERLETFAAHLPHEVRHAFEFRHPDWYVEEVCDTLDAHGMAFVEHDGLDLRPPRHTGGFRYLRFHGRTAPISGGRYGKHALRPYARDLKRWRGDAFVYFNNDLYGHAIRDALDLSDLLGERAGEPRTRREVASTLAAAAS